MYFCVPEPAAAVERAGKGEGKGNGRGHDKDGREREHGRGNAGVDADHSIACVSMTTRTMMTKPLFDALDHVCFCAWALVSDGLASSAWTWVSMLRSGDGPGERDGLTGVLCGFGVVSALWATLRAHADARVTPKVERALAAGFGVVAWAVSAACVFVLPSGAMEFDVGASADALNAWIARVVGERHAAETASGTLSGWFTSNSAAIAIPRVSPAHIGALFSFFGACIAGLLLAGISRAAKTYALATDLPEWSLEYVGYARVPKWRKGVVHAAFAAPVFTLACCAPSMVADPLGWSDAEARRLRASAFMCTGVVIFASVQPLVQAHLDSGFIAWYSIAHDSDSLQTDDEKRTQLARLRAVERRLRIVDHVVCKVALQLAAPALLLLACGLGSWHYEDILHQGADDNNLDAALLFASIFAALAWFVCAWMVPVGAVAVTLARRSCDRRYHFQ